VDKKREIYFIDNVKFHIDEVKGLGTFVEIEAIDKDGTIGKDKLQEQCQSFLELFKIPQTDLISVSYSDLLMQKVRK
jgi:adenylate cyclase, class 2